MTLRLLGIIKWLIRTTEAVPSSKSNTRCGKMPNRTWARTSPTWKWSRRIVLFWRMESLVVVLSFWYVRSITATGPLQVDNISVNEIKGCARVEETFGRSQRVSSNT